MSVADLGASGPRALASGCVCAFHEACVRGEVLEPVGDGEVDGDVLLDAAVGEGVRGAFAAELDGRGGEVVLVVSALDVGDELAPLIAFMERACLRTKRIPAPTTRSPEKGRSARRKRSGSARRLRCRTVFPSRSKIQT
jgi:hypothetical protein